MRGVNVPKMPVGRPVKHFGHLASYVPVFIYTHHCVAQVAIGGKKRMIISTTSWSPMKGQQGRVDVLKGDLPGRDALEVERGGPKGGRQV